MILVAEVQVFKFQKLPKLNLTPLIFHLCSSSRYIDNSCHFSMKRILHSSVHHSGLNNQQTVLIICANLSTNSLNIDVTNMYYLLLNIVTSSESNNLDIPAFWGHKRNLLLLILFFCCQNGFVWQKKHVISWASRRDSAIWQKLAAVMCIQGKGK